MKNIRSLWVWLLLLGLTSFSAIGQQAFVVRGAGSQFKIAGTSNLHDWESVASIAEGKGTFTLNQGKLTGISQLEVRVPVKAIQSGKAQMDKLTYDALKADKYPTLTYKLSEVQSLVAQSGGWQITALGQLTLAGQTRTVTLKVQASAGQNGALVFTGSIPVHLPNYGIAPPTALLGALTTGEDVKVSFNLPMAPAQPQ